MSSYKTKAKQALGSVKNSGGASYMQKQENAANKQIASYGAYKGGKYAQMVESAMADILNRRGGYNTFGTDQVFADYARDYSALSGLAAADTQAQVGNNMTGGYGNDYAAQAAQQSYINNLQGMNNGLMDQIAAANQIRAGQMDDAYTGGQLAGSAGAFDYQKWQDKLSNLQNARTLWNAAYEKANAVDRQAYGDNQSYMANMSQYYGDLAETQAQRKADKTNADHQYELDRYSTYGKLAEEKCRHYQDKGDNAGMKKYLKQQVKVGKITQKMADDIYLNNKYVPPKRASSTKKVLNASDVIQNGDVDPKGGSKSGGAKDSDDKKESFYSEFGAHLRGDLGKDYTNKQLETYIEKYCKSGQLTDEQATQLYNTFRKSSANVFQRTRNPITGELGLK